MSQKNIFYLIGEKKIYEIKKKAKNNIFLFFKSLLLIFLYAIF